MHVKKLVEPDISKEVQSHVEKLEEPEHAPEANQPELVGQLAPRRDRERNQQEDQCPIARGVGNDLNRICAQVSRVRLPCQPCKRCKASQKNNGFEPANHFWRMLKIFPQVHAVVQTGHLIGVTVEHDRRTLDEFS